ncbi:tyrosine-type recombinase/integrase, partial [Klebsiella pneumoniae]|uniref:tyrosine-type recombinase/integrase n=1 Tax=Klebsiella pneumoniae TaxID=573 RepID=UPI002730ACD5
SKRKQAHTVHVNKAAAKALRDLLKIRREMGHPESDDAPLIVSRNHRGLSVRSFQSRMKKWVQSAGLPVSATPHWFRHTLAMRLMRNSSA